MNATKEVIEKLRDMSSHAQFISFTYRSKSSNELARHTLIFGASYKTQINKSLEALNLLMPTYTGVQKLAAEELKDSFEETLRAFSVGEYNASYNKPDTYVSICTGMKFYVAGGTMNVSGLKHAKVVLEPGRHLKTNNSVLVAAKNQIRKTLPIARWREFIIHPDYLQKARLNGETIELE